MDPAKARREALAHQLPLQKGRKVAFRQPVKKSGQAAAAAAALAGGHAPGGLLPGEEEGETWIMATVMDCINNDRNRCVFSFFFVFFCAGSFFRSAFVARRG